MIEQLLIEEIHLAFKKVFDVEVDKKQLQLQKTLKEFEGDITLVVFPLLRFSKKSPEQTATMIGEYLQ